MTSVSAASPPLVAQVRMLDLRDKLLMVIATAGSAFLAYLSMMANSDLSQIIVDSGTCVPLGQHSPDGSLTFSAAFACGVMFCAALASLQGSRILFSDDVGDRTRVQLARLLGLLAVGSLCAGFSYDRTTAALDQRDIKAIVQGVVSLSNSPEARAVQFTGWMVLANVFSMAVVVRMMYSRSDKPGTAFAQVGHALVDKVAASLKQKLKKTKTAAEKIKRQ